MISVVTRYHVHLASTSRLVLRNVCVALHSYADLATRVLASGPFHPFMSFCHDLLRRINQTVDIAGANYIKTTSLWTVLSIVTSYEERVDHVSIDGRSIQTFRRYYIKHIQLIITAKSFAPARQLNVLPGIRARPSDYQVLRVLSPSPAKNRHEHPRPKSFSAPLKTWERTCALWNKMSLANNYML